MLKMIYGMKWMVMMKMKLSKLEARLIDEANNLKMINKIRNRIHYLMN